MCAPAMKMPEKINSASTAATTDRKTPTRRRSSSPTTPVIVVAPNTAVRNPTPTQNNLSVRHQPVISPVATTEVAHPLMMLTADAATAVALLGERSGPEIRTRTPLTMPVADSSGSVGPGPHDCRLMMLVRVSSLSGSGIGPVGGGRRSPGRGSAGGLPPIGLGPLGSPQTSPAVSL